MEMLTLRIDYEPAVLSENVAKVHLVDSARLMSRY